MAWGFWRAPGRGEPSPGGEGDACGTGCRGAPACLPLGAGTWLDRDPWLQSLFSKKGEAICGKQPWGLFIEVTGNPQRVRTSLFSWTTEGVCQLLLTGTQSLPSPWKATKPGWIRAIGSGPERVRDGGVGLGRPQDSQGYTWGTPEGCLKVGSLGLGLGGKIICQVRKGILV